jgi:bifunctional non-homologous end joining protein LigD
MQLGELEAALAPAQRKKPACTGPLPKGRGYHWVEPRLCCEVRYKHLTDEGLLRQPVFLRLRDDKEPHACTLEHLIELPAGAPTDAEEPAPPTPPPARAVGEPRKVVLSNQDKIFWPDDGYTKGDLCEFYRAISPWLLPYLRDRPVVLTRYPDGIAGKSFFQKDAPPFVPGWLRTERIWSEQSQREIDYFICDDEPSLLYVINMGSIPLHAWSSRVHSIAQPDWCILDLDPKEAPFAHVLVLARAIHMLCDELELPSYVKTSGQKGMHVLFPLGQKLTYEQSRQLAMLIAQVVSDEHPDIATTARVIGARKGRVYVDALQNGHGRTIVAPFSVRPQPGAPVSTPLRWSEVSAKLDPRKHTIKTLPARIEKLGEDPFAGVLRGTPNLVGALERLDERLKRGAK